MSDSHEPREAEIAALVILGNTLAHEVEVLLRWLVRRVWWLRSIVLMDVALFAWNAASIGNGWLSSLNVIGCMAATFGAWHALKTEARVQQDIKEGRERLQDVRTKLKNLTG